MKLTHENGVPATKWIVELPVTGMNVMNRPTSTMNVERITLMAKADCSISYSGRNAILTFAQPESGMAILIIGDSKRPLIMSILASNLPDVE